MAGTRKKPATAAKAPVKKSPAKKAAPKKTEERVVHAESITLEVARVGSKWYVSSKHRTDTEVRELTVEQAADLVGRRPASFTHHEGLKGGEKFDDLVYRYSI